MKADTKPVAAPPQCYVHCYNWVPSVKITHSSHNRCQGAPSFWFSMTFPWPKNENPWPIGTTFPSKRYTTYECIPELVVTVPYARSTIVKKIKQFIIWLYKWSRVTFTELLSAVVKIQRHYHYFPWLSMTFAIFHDFPGLENGLPKFHDFPRPGGTLHCDFHITFTNCTRWKK